MDSERNRQMLLGIPVSKNVKAQDIIKVPSKSKYEQDIKKGKEHICDVCYYKPTSILKKTPIKYYKMVCPEDEQFVCGDCCGFVTKKYPEMLQHMKCHMVKVMKCEYCNFQTGDASCLELHLRRHGRAKSV